MKVFSTITAVLLSLALTTLPPAAQAASKAAQARAKTHQVAKKTKAALRHLAAKSARRMKESANYLAHLSDRQSPSQAGAVRTRNEGVPLEAAVNVPRPVVTETSAF